MTSCKSLGPPEPELELEPGDKVSASVTRQPDGPDGSLNFKVRITVTDKTGKEETREADLLPIKPPAQENDAAWQGGCILESEPQGFSGPPGMIPIFPSGGLAKFDTAQFTGCSVNGQTLDAYPNTDLYQWNMNPNESKDPIPTPGALGQNGAFSVGWNGWH